MQTFHQFRFTFTTIGQSSQHPAAIFIQLKRTHEIQFYDDVNCVATCRHIHCRNHASIRVEQHASRVDACQRSIQAYWVCARWPAIDEIKYKMYSLRVFENWEDNRVRQTVQNHICAIIIISFSCELYSQFPYSSRWRLGDSAIEVYDAIHCWPKCFWKKKSTWTNMILLSTRQQTTNVI